jgi:hypothetical protein
MRWIAVLVVLAACAPPEPAGTCEADEAAPADAPVSELAAPLPLAPAPPPRAPVRQASLPLEMPAPEIAPSPVGAIVAAPSGATRAVAVTHDGTTAVSADVDGHVRLWPSLDGSLEPVVVAMRRPVSLAIVRNGDNLAIAGIDGAGQLEIVQVGLLRQPLWRRPVELSRPVIDLRATQVGFLVETDDQHLAFVDTEATVKGEVEPPPGTDIAAIAVNSDRMLALLSSDGAVHGRWLVVPYNLEWGDQTAKLPISPRAIALSPDSTMLAGTVVDSSATRLVVIGIEHANRRAISGDDQSDPAMRPVRWLDNGTLLVEGTQQLTVWAIEPETKSLDVVSSLEPGPAAIDGGATAVVGAGAELMLADRAGTAHFLGFRFPNPSLFAAGRRSLLASDGQRVLRIGEDLRAHASYDLSRFNPSVTATVLALLDQTHVLMETYRSQLELQIVALDTLEVTPIDEPGWYGYDPAAHLAAFAHDKTVRFRRFDPKTATFGPAAELATESNSTSVAFIDGVASVTTYTDTGYVTRTVTRIRPEKATLTVAQTHKQSFTAQPETMLGPAAPPFWRSVKSPDGTLTARLGSNRISLRDAEGNVRWTVAANGAYDLEWMQSGELLAIGAGLASIDVDSGAFAVRRCGWEFGLWAQRDNAFASSTMCDAE